MFLQLLEKVSVVALALSETAVMVALVADPEAVVLEVVLAVAVPEAEVRDVLPEATVTVPVEVALVAAAAAVLG